jgi:drug/metabolite transporter (DMT)-like permease
MSFLVPFAAPASSYVMASSRYVVGIAAVSAMALLGLTRLQIRNWPWLVVRGVFGAFATYLYYYAIVKLGLGMGTILNNTYPVFAAVLAPLLLGDRLPWDVAAAVIVSFAGIYLVINPFAAGAHGLGTPALLALLGGLTAGVAIVAIKKLRETESSPVIYLSQCVFGILLTGYPTAASPLSFGLSVWAALLGIGVLATVAQLLMTSAYGDVPATEGSLLGFLTPVLNAVLGVLVFGESFRPLALAGSLIVLAACLYVALRERIVGAVR